MGTGNIYTEVKWLECEADHSPPSSDKVWNAWSFTSMGQYLGTRETTSFPYS